MTRHLTLLAVAALIAGGSSSSAQSVNGCGNGSDKETSPTFHDKTSDGPVYQTRDLAGRLWAVWSYNRGLDADIAVSRAVGNTWTNPVLIGEANNAVDLDPRFVFLPDGTGLLVWWQQFEDPSDNRVMMATTDGGGVWSEPVRLSPGGVSSRTPTIFLAADGSDPLIGFVTGPEEGPNTVYLTPSGGGSDSTGGTNGPDPIPTFNEKWTQPYYANGGGSDNSGNGGGGGGDGDGD